MIKQPAYINIEKRIVGTLDNSDKAMNDSFWLGVWPGLSEKHLIYIVDKVILFLQNEIN